MAHATRRVERRLSRVVRNTDTSAVGEQRVDDFEVVVPRGKVKRRVRKPVLEIDVSAVGLEEPSADLACRETERLHTALD